MPVVLIQRYHILGQRGITHDLVQSDDGGQSRTASPVQSFTSLRSWLPAPVPVLALRPSEDYSRLTSSPIYHDSRSILNFLQDTKAINEVCIWRSLWGCEIM